MDQNVEDASVAVLMPVYNSENYLRVAIESILNQTYSHFVFYIINDGSTDNSQSIILSYKDERIRYLKNETNRGLIYTLNRGLELINSKYLVRMDADDISMPDRIEKQVEFMEMNSDIWVLGSQIQYFGEASHRSNFPLSHDLINAKMLFGSALVHPSIIMRLDQIKKNKLYYDEQYLHVEDFELWTRVARLGKLANLEAVYLKYRMEGQNITINNWHSREGRLVKIYSKLLDELGVECSEQNLILHIELTGNSVKVDDLYLLKKYSDHLLVKNRDKLIYSQSDLRQAIDECWSRLFFKVADYRLSDALKFWKITESFSWSQFKYIVGAYRSKCFK